MRRLTGPVLVAGLSATALLAAGCGGGSSPAPGTAGTGAAGGSITVFGCNPEHALIPADTNENCGGRVMETTVARLIHYNTDTAKPEMDIAESIETKDNQNFTIKIKKGYKFSDGTEVKAKNFVDAWNYTVANSLQNEYFMAAIDGYKDVAPGPDPDGEGPKTAPPGKSKTMSGLKVVDDTTFTVKTKDKVSNLPVRLGYYVFAPLPDVFFTDPKAFGEKPIGAGPYKVDSWTKNAEIKVSKNPNYSGKFAGKVDAITYKIFTDSEAAYNEVMANNLDVTDEIPTSALINDKYKQDLPDRNGQDDSGGIQTLTFPPVKTDPTYGNPKLRQAISMAIDRKTITEKIFNKARVPADGWVAPGIDGAKPGACGEYCVYDPAKAKAKFTEAGGYTGKLTLSYNGDASHKVWTEAACNSIKNALGVECVATPVTDFATFRAQINAQKMKGMFRSGWIMDYPSIENFLSPLYATGGSSNDSKWSNAAFDAKLNEAAAAPTLDQANALYQQAEVMLKDGMPAIPLWYYKINYGWSNKVTDVKATPFNEIDYASIQIKK